MSKKKKNRKGTATEAEMARRKRQHDAEYEQPEKPMTKAKDEEDDLTTSEEYEDMAGAALNAGDAPTANAYATLALAATIREATFIFADLIDPSDDDGDEDEDQ